MFKAGIYVTMMFEVLRTLLVVKILNLLDKVIHVNNINLLLTEFELWTEFFPLRFMAQVRSALAI